MDNQQASDHKLKNLLHSLLLIVGMASVLAVSSRLLFGADLWWLVLVVIVSAMLMLPNASPYWLLRLYQARPVGYQQFPQLQRVMDTLTQRAGLPRAPELFWVPSHNMNAFAVGNRDASAIAVTHGLLQNLSMREIAGVLAHEISHIRNHDLRIMALADTMTRLTHVLSMTGLLLFVVSLPLVLLGQASISLLGLAILIVSPSVNALLQLGLSRVREFDADLDAARLTQDPEGLASALSRIEGRQSNWWQRIMLPGYRDQQPSIMRSHPNTDERVKRLLSLHSSMPQQSPRPFDEPPRYRNPYSHIVIRRPRHRFLSGTWR